MKKLTLLLLMLMSMLVVVGTTSVLANELPEDPVPAEDPVDDPEDIPEDEDIAQDEHYPCNHKTDQPHNSGHTTHSGPHQRHRLD